MYHSACTVQHQRILLSRNRVLSCLIWNFSLWTHHISRPNIHSHPKGLWCFDDFNLELTQIRSTENRCFKVFFYLEAFSVQNFWKKLYLFFSYKYFKQKFLSFEIQRFKSTSENVFQLRSHIWLNSSEFQNLHC